MRAVVLRVRNALRRLASAVNSGGRSFSATSRPSLVSRARYTSPIPPAPSGATTSYGPSFVPKVRHIRARNYSRKSAAFTLTSNGLRVALIRHFRWGWYKKQFVYRKSHTSNIAPLGWITPEWSATRKLLEADDELLMGQRWRKKYIIAAMISNASRKRKMVQLLLVSGVIGELSIASPTLPKLAFAVFASPDFASSIVASSV
jgi:hypothetical protein